MKKILIFVFILIGLNSCVLKSDVTFWDKTSIFKINREGLNPFYFQYPAQGNVTIIDEKQLRGVMEYSGCKINFGKEGSFELKEGEDFQKNLDMVKDGIVYNSYFRNDIVMAYSAHISEEKYLFWVFEDNGTDASKCIDAVDYMAKTFTSSPNYMNENFSFGAPILEDYKMEYLGDDSGVSFKKTFQLAKEELESIDPKQAARFPAEYTVEIGVHAFLNDALYHDLGGFLNNEYPGYSLQYLQVGDVSGVYVDEENDLTAIRHFFVMSVDTEIIYEAYLKVLTVYYGRHKDFFDENLVKKLSFF